MDPNFLRKRPKAYLEQSCGGDDALRREVHALLEEEPQVSSQFLRETAFADVTAWCPRFAPFFGANLG